MRSLRFALATLVFVAALPAHAQPAEKQAPVDVASILKRVGGSDAATVVDGLGAAKDGGAAAGPAAPAIEALLGRGTSVAVAKAAIDALGAIGAPSSSAVLRPYVHHRVADLRRGAVRALVRTKGPQAVLAFREGLRSSDAMIRGFSATGLGNLGAGDAMPDLFLALDHNVPEAAAAIGQLCAPADCEKFAAKIGSLGFDVVTSGLDPMIFRKNALADDVLLRILGRVRELGTSDAGKYMADVQSRWPKTGSPKVKQAIDSAVGALPKGAGP